MRLSGIPEIKYWSFRERQEAEKHPLPLHRIAYLLYHDRGAFKILEHSDPVAEQRVF